MSHETHETLSIQIKGGFNIVGLRFDEINRRLDRIERRLDKIEDDVRAARKVDA